MEKTMIDNSTATINEQEAIAFLKEYIAKTGKTQVAIAKELDVSDGMISAFLKGTYNYSHKIIPKIVQLLKITERKAASPKEPEFKMTSISQQVINIIEYCQLQGKIGVAYGDAGIGKTMAVKEYVKQNPGAIKITISPCYATITGVNELLAEELKVREKVSRKVYSEIVNKLKDSQRVIIIDEAQHLTVRVINHLRSITDESGIGIAFVGNEEIYLKMKGAGQTAYAQLFSRIGHRAYVEASKITLDDVMLVFEDAQLDEKTLGILHKISKTNYGLRGAVNVFVNAIVGYQIKDYKELNSSKIACMAREMNIA